MKKILIIIPVLIAVILVVWSMQISVKPGGGMLSVTLSNTVQAAENGIELSRTKKTQLADALDGSKRYSIISSLNYIQMREDGGEWEDINPTLDIKGLPAKVPYELVPYLTGLPGFHYKSKQSGEFEIRLKEARTDSISITPIDPKPNVKPIIKDNTITWVDLYPDVDVVLTAFNTGVSLNRIIKSPSAPLEYDVIVTEIEKGVAQLMPIKPAEDADGQLIKMEEKPTLDGRTETLKLEVLPQEGVEIKPIAYPIKDSTIIDDQPVGASADDGIARIAPEGFFTNNDYIETGSVWSGSHGFCSYMRFLGINIPSGANIDSAYVTFIAFSSKAVNDVRSDLCCENSNNPNAPSDYDDYMSKTRTSPIQWDAIGAWVDEESYQSLSIISAVQEVVDDQSGTGNALIVFWEDKDDESDEGALRDACSYDYDDHSYAPKIYIEYTEGGGDPDISVLPISYDFGVVAESTTPYTATDYFTITNNSTMQTDQTISVTSANWTGGVTWTHSDTATAGSDTAGLKANKDGTWGVGDVIVKYSSPNYICENCTANTSYSFGLKLISPTVFSDGVEKEIVVRVTATAD